MVKSQISPATLLMMAYSAMKPATLVRIGALASGLNSSRSVRIPAAKGSRNASRKAPQKRETPLHQLPGNEGREHRHFALREIQMIDGLVDHHYRERHAGIDRAGRDAGQALLGKD